jgi:hypothetical protein
VHLVDEVPQHLLGDVEVRDYSMPQRPDGLDVRWRAPDHPLGFHPHLERSVVTGVDGNHRRLVEHDAHATNEHKRVRRAQIDGHVAAGNGKEIIKHRCSHCRD